MPVLYRFYGMIICYTSTLEKLGEQDGIHGKMFNQVSNKIRNAAIPYRVVQMIEDNRWRKMGLHVFRDYQEKFLNEVGVDHKVQDQTFVSDEEISAFMQKFDHITGGERCRLAKEG